MLKGIRKKTAILMTLLLCLSMADYSVLMTAYAEETEETAETAVESEAEESVQELAETSTEEEDTNEGEYSLTYEVKDGNAVITGYTGELPSELVLPDTIDGYTVTEIGHSVFEDADITSVVIPDGVTTIRGYAFSKCKQLVSVQIPDSVVTIELCAFEDCSSLERIIIPDSVTRMDGGVFMSCESLKEITLPDSLQEISDDVFSGCSSLVSVDIPDSVHYIGVAAFSDCSSLERISIPDGVTKIGFAAFFGCESLKEITLPDSVQYIDYAAFQDCSSLVSMDIPDSVTSIATWTFCGCSSLENVNIPEGVTIIHACAFGDCESLSEITLPSSLQYIYEQAFSGCKKITSLQIPASVTWIGAEAFSQSGISEIYFYGNAPEIDSDDSDNEYPGVFEGTTLTVFYPADNPTWTEDVMQPYGAESIEWIPWNPETEEIQGYIDVIEDSENAETEIGVHVIGSGDDLVLECNLPLQYFVSVEIDGVTVDPSNYELKSGSTIITFDGSFLDTLTPGNHTVTMHYNINGRKVAVKTSIVIREKSGSTDKPSKTNTPDSSKPSKPNNSDSSKPSNGSTGTASETAAASQNKVTMKAHLVDANGQPMYNCTLEIHSDPVSATLGNDGTASFNNIEVGDHIMYLKDQNGKVLASKAIKIVYDKSYSITGGDTIHVVKGRAFILNVKYDEENLILLSVEGDQTPATGDTSTAHIWILLMALSAVGIVLVLARKRKQIR